MKPPRCAADLRAAACAVFVVCAGGGAGGCAVGRTNSGGVVFGAELGGLADNANQALVAAGDMLFGPVGGVVATGVLGLGGVAARLWASSARARGRDEGWDDRERAAAVQLPLSDPRRPDPDRGDRGPAPASVG